MGLGARNFLATAAVGVGLLVACGDSSPPLLGDSNPEGGVGETSLFPDRGTPACNAGPGLSVCACTEISFLMDVPNLMFVLDRSGSMADMNKWTTIRVVLLDVMMGLGPRANFGITMFPDGTSNNACAAGQVVMTMRPGDSPAGTDGAATEAARKVTAAAPAGGTPTAATLTALLPTLRSLGGKTYVILATDGGPNCDAMATCGADMCIDNIESVSGCPPAGNPNCCDPSVYGPLDCLDAQPTIDAVTAIAAAGISVYVVGVPGSGPYGGLLDQLAQAGGTARASEPLYYQVTSADQTAFESTLHAIAAKITGTCTLALSEPPPDPNQVNVYFNNTPVAADPVNGWTLSGSTITLVGNACTEVLSGQVLNVRVVAGCATLQPN